MERTHLWIPDGCPIFGGSRGGLAEVPTGLKSMTLSLALPCYRGALAPPPPRSHPFPAEGGELAGFPLGTTRAHLKFLRPGPGGGPSGHHKSHGPRLAAHAAGFEGWPETLVGTAHCPNWASLGRRQVLLLTCLCPGCCLTLSRRTARFLVWLAPRPARAEVHPCSTNGEIEALG